MNKEKPTEKKKRVIALCSSISFFKEVLAIEKQLERLGLALEIPHVARKMRESGDYRVGTYKTWFKNPRHYGRKAWLMKNYFEKIKKSDAILVVNKTKNRIGGYIGGATLAEMVIAFHYKKPIYVLHPVSTKIPYYEEILGMQPIFLNGDIGKIKKV